MRQVAITLILREDKMEKNKFKNNLNKKITTFIFFACFLVISFFSFTHLEDKIFPIDLLDNFKQTMNLNVQEVWVSGRENTKLEEIVSAIKKNVLLINIESESEAMLIDKICKKMSKKVSVGIRLNPNISGKTHKKISTGGKDEKFGLPYNNFINLCKKIKQMKNLKFEGLSVHIGSQITNIEPFRRVLTVIDKVIEKTKINFKFIDLGGGMGISYNSNDNQLNIKHYAKVVNKFLKNKNTKIIFEPGRFLIGNTAILVTKILYIKKILIKFLLFWM